MSEIDSKFIEKRRQQKRNDYLKNRDAYLRRAKEFYQRNKAKNTERSIKWNETHRERRKLINKKYRLTHQTQIRKKATEMRFRNRSQINQYARERYVSRKLDVLKHYSPNLDCQCCGEQQWMFLSIDHVDGRKQVNHDRSMVGRKLYDWLKKNNYPEGFQVLCMNCNFAKGMWGKCPHTMEVIQSHG